MAQSTRELGKTVVYQIYIKSFCDSDGDGVGDLPGIASKLDYLAYLGVDYLWITPFFPSPQHDNGYDVADYCAVDPVYGAMDDFDALVAAARERGIGIMLDMVLCHTSRDHAWFQRALAGDERYQRYYILRDGRGSTGPGDPGEPPTNWQCAFGGSAWEWESALGKWYLHLHDVSQPDLNWENPEVRAELANVVRFWKGHGVSGFRFDVINLISKPAVFEDDAEGLGRRLFADGPHAHEFIQGLVRDARIDGMITVGEMASTDLANCVRYTRPEDHELSMTFSFHHLKVDYKDGDKWALQEPDIAQLREIFRSWQEGMQAGGGVNALFWDNHDQPRAVTRFGGRDAEGVAGGSWEHVGKMLATCTFFMRGVPYVFQGDELGMTNAGFGSIDEFRDVETFNNYRILLDKGATPAEALHIVNERSRDNGRTPMQWTAGPAAGFTTGEPWIGVPANHARINVEAEQGSAGSMLEFYRELIRMRHELDVVARGRVGFVDAGADAPRAIVYERWLEGADADAARAAGAPTRLLVACSFDDAACRVVPVRPDGAAVDLADARVLVDGYDDGAVAVDAAAGAIELRPHEAVVLALDVAGC